MVHAGSLGSIHGQGTLSHMPQLRVCMSKLRSSTAKYIFFFIKKTLTKEKNLPKPANIAYFLQNSVFHIWIKGKIVMNVLC